VAVVAVLDREMFSVSVAARLLSVPTSTLSYWLEGGERRGKRYKPLLRPEPLQKRTVTWAEFVEAGLLSSYRRKLNVPMAELRAFIDLLRDELGVPYPLADRRPYVLNRQLVEEVQASLGLDPEWCLVAKVNGQLILTPASENFLERVEWEGDRAAGWRPAADISSPVRINPEVRFGRPAIKGISTDVIWEQEDAGEDVQDLAETYGLTVADVHWALSYENSRRAQQATRAA
jgi:uncharacterized protein (DUF433 family)